MDEKKINELIEALRQIRKEQTREEMQRNIRGSTNEKILRRQIEMLTEYSRTCGLDSAPEANKAIAALYMALIEAKCLFFMGIFVTFFGFFYLVKSFQVKRVQFIKR